MAQLVSIGIGSYIGILGIAAFSMILVGVTFVRTNALLELKAWLLGRPIMHILQRDSSIRKELGEKVKTESIKVKRYGYASITSNSHLRDDKTKLTNYFMFSEFGATLPPHYAAILQELREMGHPIHNFDDYDNVLAMEKEIIQREIKRIREVDPNFTYDPEEYETKITIHTGKTYSLHELADMFPFDLHPAHIESLVEREVLEQKGKEKFDPRWVVYGMVAMLGAAVAYVIIASATNNPSIGGQAAAPVVTGIVQANQSLGVIAA